MGENRQGPGAARSGGALILARLCHAPAALLARAATWLALLCMLLPGAPAPAQAATKAALVIGNARYADQPLANPENDARDLSQALQGLGFRATTVLNGTRQAMLDAVRTHAAAVGPGALSVFYFAGHGVQMGGRNFLVPVDAKLQRAEDLLQQGVSLDDVIEAIAKGKPRFHVLILDACRDSPFQDGKVAGLAPLDAPPNTLIAFATSPGKVAADGSGRNGLYTSHLLRHLGGADRRIEEVFKLVRVGVLEDSAGRQLPWENTALTAELGLAAFPQALAERAPPLAAAAPAWIAGASERDLRNYLTQNRDPAVRQPVTARLVRLRSQAPIRREALALAEIPCPGCPRITPVEIAAPGGAKTLWLSTDLVTVREYRGCVAARECPAPPDLPRADAPEAETEPVSGISAQAAASFAAWLNRQPSAYTFRLPTQDEWQRVYRSGYFDERQRPLFETQSACLAANLYDQNGAQAHRFNWSSLPCSDGFHEAAPVGLFLPSANGLFDLIGNLWQWTSSCVATAGGAPCAQQRLVGGSWATGKNWSWEQPPTLSAEADLGAPIFGLRVVATRRP